MLNAVDIIQIATIPRRHGTLTWSATGGLSSRDSESLCAVSDPQVHRVQRFHGPESHAE
jgi:hypothetical protein